MAASLNPSAVLTAALSDRYELQGEIGHGGMATVFAARDRRHDARVAIKILHPELAATVGGARFAREVRITASLQHPHILPVLDSGVAEGLPYYIMPFVDGESLAVRLSREQRLPVDEAVHLAAEVADALSHAHAVGIVHRDIKPDNILLSHGHAMVADFGVAKAIDISAADKLTESGLVMGTVTYMSPEQAGNEPVDGRSDIYALGCVLYEALAGAPPFTGSSVQTVMARHAVDPVPSVRTVRPTVPEALETAIDIALAKVPQDRYATASDFREAILAAIADEPGSTRRGGPRSARSQQRPARPVRRWRSAVAGGATVAVIGLAAWAATRLLPPKGPVLDANRVIVFPLVVSGGGALPASAGEDAATMIGSAMNGAGELRWVDGWQQLPPTQRENVRLLADSTVFALARRERCAFAITGRMVARGDSAEVVLTLHDVRADSTYAPTPVHTSVAGESWRAGLAAVTALLPTLIPVRTPDVAASWADRAPQAVAHFLRAESAFRRLQLPAAVAAYDQAVAADSGFAFAALRGAQAASWNHQPDAAAALVAVALRQPLAPRDAPFARGLHATFAGLADSAVNELREAIRRDSTNVVAWLQLGEVYTHLLPSTGNTDSLAEAAFVEAYRRDSLAAQAQYHQIEIAVRRGDRARAQRLAATFLRTAVDSQLRHDIEVVTACGDDRFDGLDLPAVVASRPLAVLAGAKSLASGRRTAGCARAAYAAILAGDTAATDAADGRRWGALLGLTAWQLSRGQQSAAEQAIDAYYARWGAGQSIYLLAAPVMPTLAARARAVARRDSVDHGAALETLPYPVRIWENGVWAAREGQGARVAQLAARLRAIPDSTTSLARMLAASLDAHAALAMGDTALAMSRFDALIRRHPHPGLSLAWVEPASLGIDRVMYARLLLARRDPRTALELLDVLDSALPVVFPLYLPESLRLRATAAEALGQRALATTFRTRLRALSGG